MGCWLAQSELVIIAIICLIVAKRLRHAQLGLPSVIFMLALFGLEELRRRCSLARSQVSAGRLQTEGGVGVQ